MTERTPITTPALPGGLPFDATQIQFTQGGTGPAPRTLQAKEREILSITDFQNTNGTKVGALAGQDDTTGVQRAIAWATDSAVAGNNAYPPGTAFGASRGVFVPSFSAGWRVSNLNIYAPMSFYGENPKGSRFIGLAGSTGYMFNVDGFNVSASRNNNSLISGVQFKNLGFEGNNRMATYGCLYLSGLTDALFENLKIELFTQQSLKLYSSVIESAFKKIWTRYCGNVSTGHPDIDLFDEHAVAGQADANNMCTFDDVWSIFPFGHHVNLDTLAGRSFVVRDIFFNKCMFHSVVSGGLSGEPTPTTAQESTSAIIIGSATGVHITDCYVPTQGTAVSTIYQKAGSHATGPSGTIINGLHTAGRTAATPSRIGIKVEVGDVSIDNVRLQNCQEGSIVTSAGTTVRLGPNINLDEVPIFAAGTAITKQYGSQEFQQARVDKRVVLADAATLAVDASLGNYFTCGMGATGRTVGAPTNPRDGQEITFELLGFGGGVPTIMAWNAVFLLKSGPFALGSALTRSISFKYNGTNWVEMSRDPLPQGNFTLTDAAPVTVDALKGGTFFVTITAARQIANPTNRTPGQRITFVIIQDGTGARAVTWDTAYKVTWSDTGNTANKRSTITFIDDDATTYLTQTGAQSPYVT